MGKGRAGLGFDGTIDITLWPSRSQNARARQQAGRMMNAFDFGAEGGRLKLNASLRFVGSEVSYKKTN